MLTAEAPICGSGAPLVASNQSQVVTSPAHPAHYPASVSCEWVVDAGSPEARLSLAVTQLDLEDSPACAKDSLLLEDIGGWSTVQRDAASGGLVLSSLSPNMLDYYWRMVNIFSDIQIFFGHVPRSLETGAPVRQLLRHEPPPRVYQRGPHREDPLLLGRHRDQARLQAGVQARQVGVTCHVSRVLTVTTRSCDRVYDASHGRLLSPRWPSSVPRDTDCRFSVSAPDPAATVSVYFRYFRVSTSANCSDNYLEVRDGPGQDTSPLLARVRSRDV